MGERLRKAGLIATIAALSLVGNSCQKQSSDSTTPKKPKTEQVPVLPRVSNSTVDITFAVDTLERPTGALAFCSRAQIVRNFVENDDRFALNLSVIAHENKHRDNFLKGLRSLKLSPLQYAKMSMHDEISASMCELLTKRYEYLAADDKQAYLEKAKKGKFSYYFKAVANGDIFPEAGDKRRREQEWDFIAKETKSWWMKVYAPVYLPSIIRMTERYLERMDPNVPENVHDINYQKVAKIAYNIGGIDFGKYMGQDIQITDEQISLINQVGLTDLFQDGKKDYCSRIKMQVNRLKEGGYQVSSDVLSHVFVAEGLKIMLKGVSADVIKQNPEIITMCYSRLHEKLITSQNISTMFSQIEQKKTVFAFSSEPPISEELIRQIYSYKGTDLSKYVEGFNTFQQGYGLSLLKTFSSPFYDDMIQNNLNAMRAMSPQEQEAPAASPQKKTTPPRKSAPQVLRIPNFSQPILTGATQEQIEEIYQAIHDFNNIPSELKGCNLAKQALYHKKQQTK